MISQYEGVIVYLLTAGIKDIADHFGWKIDGTKTLIISGLIAALLVVGVNYALANGLLPPAAARLIDVIFTIISAAGVNKSLKVAGGLVARNGIPKK